jgi:hypothetical protein
MTAGAQVQSAEGAHDEPAQEGEGAQAHGYSCVFVYRVWYLFVCLLCRYFHLTQVLGTADSGPKAKELSAP